MSHRFPDPVGCGAVLQAAHKFTLQDAWSFGSVSTRIFAAGTAENVTLDADFVRLFKLVRGRQPLRLACSDRCPPTWCRDSHFAER